MATYGGDGTESCKTMYTGTPDRAKELLALSGGSVAKINDGIKQKPAYGLT